MVSPENNSNWLYDYGLLEDIPLPGGDLPALEPMAEKNELRDEKQKLKAEKEKIEQQMKALHTQPDFLPSAVPAAPFPAPCQVFGSKMVPFTGYPGVPMWQFTPPAAVDTSQDHTLRSPVA